jgi:hypothetical protein
MNKREIDVILERNLSKISDPKIDTIFAIFPYNQGYDQEREEGSLYPIKKIGKKF